MIVYLKVLYIMGEDFEDSKGSNIIWFMKINIKFSALLPDLC